MQMHVGEHSVKFIDMISEDKLKISIELLEKQFEQRIVKHIDNFEHKIKPKIKKRMKVAEFQKMLNDRVSEKIFYKHID